MYATVENTEVGQFVTETLVSDTRTWEVIGKTPKGLVLRSTRHTNNVLHTDGGYLPIVRCEVVPDPEGRIVRVRTRKNGGLCTNDYHHYLYPAHLIDGKPVDKTDYSY